MMENRSGVLPPNRRPGPDRMCKILHIQKNERGCDCPFGVAALLSDSRPLPKVCPCVYPKLPT